MGKGFNKLAGKVTREYEEKGFSKATAEQYGKATAGKVYREQQEKHKCCGMEHSHADGHHHLHVCPSCYGKCKC